MTRKYQNAINQPKSKRYKATLRWYRAAHIVSELKKTIMPYVVKFLSSDFLLNSKRNTTELARKIKGKPHQLDVFLAPANPYSYILVQVLPELVSRFSLQVKVHTVKDLQGDMFPDYPKWQQNSLLDADRVASLYKLKSPKCNTSNLFNIFDKERIDNTTSQMLLVEKDTDVLKKIEQLLSDYWTGKATRDAPITNMSVLLEDNQQRLKRLGHYYSAMVYYGQEWYWGVDRLDHLEKRLYTLNLGHKKPIIKYNLQTCSFCASAPVVINNNTPLELFFSARSPYSYIGLVQSQKLAKYYGVRLEIKLVLPMMMRGVNVPNTKKMYIFHDTKREAKKLGIEYGFVADPLGKAVENCYSLYPYAESEGKGVEFLLSFSRAVNSQGIRADQKRGLSIIIERCGLNWSIAQHYLGDKSWLEKVETNFEELQNMGLWGVPCFKYENTLVWGQDRMWAIEDAIRSNGAATL